jgi:protein TonB
MPEEPIVSPKKQPQAEAKKPAPKKPPRRPQPRPQQAPADQAQARATPEAGAGGGDQGLRQVGGFAAYSSDAVDQVPVISRRVLPDYPLKARRRDLQGRVVVRLVVDATGMPRACVVQEANPRGYFEDAALEAARQTRFIPGKRQGRIVNTVVLLPFNFSLR